MTAIPETEPIFAAIPDWPEERLDLVKQFALRWSGDPVVPPPGIAERIAAAEARLRIKLPLTLQLFYESGLRDWFATHCDELCREDWQELEKLDFDERSGDLTFYIAYIGVPKRGIRPDDLSISDPPVREIKDRGHFGGKMEQIEVSPVLNPLSETLILAMLLSASTVSAGLWSLDYHEEGLLNRQLRQELTPVKINGFTDETQWRFFEGPDLYYLETVGRVWGQFSPYAAVAGRAPDMIEQFVERTYAAARSVLDWAADQQLLIEATEATVLRLFNRHPVEELCAIGYYFEFGLSHPQFEVCANTRQYFRDSIARYRKDDDEFDVDRIRWNSGDFEYPCEWSLGEAWERRYAELYALTHEEKDEFEIEKGLIEISCRSLADLARRGVLGDWTSIDFIVPSMDEDDRTIKTQDQYIRKLITGEASGDSPSVAAP